MFPPSHWFLKNFITHFLCLPLSLSLPLGRSRLLSPPLIFTLVRRGRDSQGSINYGAQRDDPTIPLLSRVKSDERNRAR